VSFPSLTFSTFPDRHRLRYSTFQLFSSSNASPAWSIDRSIIDVHADFYEPTHVSTGSYNRVWTLLAKNSAKLVWVNATKCSRCISASRLETRPRNYRSCSRTYPSRMIPPHCISSPISVTRCNNLISRTENRSILRHAASGTLARSCSPVQSFTWKITWNLSSLGGSLEEMGCKIHSERRGRD